MNEYLNNVVARTLGKADVVQPRVPSLFEFTAAAAGPVIEISAQREAPGSDVRSTNDLPAGLEGKRYQPQAITNHRIEVDEVSPHRQIESSPANRAEVSTRILPPARLEPFTELPTRGEIKPITIDRAKPISKDEQASEPSLPPAKEINEPTTIPQRGETWSELQPKIRSLFDERLSKLGEVRPAAIARQMSEHPILPAAKAPEPDAADVIRPIFKPAEPVTREPPVARHLPETISVTIGRVDVRAVFTPPQTTRMPRPAESKTSSLDEYLKRRSEGRR